LFSLFIDQRGKRSIIKKVAWLDSIIWLIKVYVISLTQIIFVNIISALTYGILDPSLEAIEQDDAKSYIIQYFVNREIYITIGRISILVIILISDSLAHGLIFNGLARLLIYLI
jgi:hypothetical protein